MKNKTFIGIVLLYIALTSFTCSGDTGGGGDYFETKDSCQWREEELNFYDVSMRVPECFSNSWLSLTPAFMDLKAPFDLPIADISPAELTWTSISSECSEDTSSPQPLIITSNQDDSWRGNFGFLVSEAYAQYHSTHGTLSIKLENITNEQTGESCTLIWKRSYNLDFTGHISDPDFDVTASICPYDPFRTQPRRIYYHNQFENF